MILWNLLNERELLDHVEPPELRERLSRLFETHEYEMESALEEARVDAYSEGSDDIDRVQQELDDAQVEIDERNKWIEEADKLFDQLLAGKDVYVESMIASFRSEFTIPKDEDD